MGDEQVSIRKRDRLVGFAAAKYKQYYAGEPAADLPSDGETKGRNSRRGSLAPQLPSVIVSGTRAETHGQTFAGVVYYSDTHVNHEDTAGEL